MTDEQEKVAPVEGEGQDDAVEEEKAKKVLAEQFAKIMNMPDADWRKGIILEFTRMYLQNRKNTLVIFSQVNQVTDAINTLDERLKLIEEKLEYLEKQKTKDEKAQRQDSRYA